MNWFTIQDNAAGRRSRSAFVATAAFWVSAFKFLFSGAEITLLGNMTLKFGHTDAALLGAFLIPCLGLYWGRRATEAKMPCPQTPVTGPVPVDAGRAVG